MQILKAIIDCDVIKTSKSSQDTYLGVMINRTKFDARTFSSFGGVKTHRHTRTRTHTHTIALYSLV